MPQWPKGVSGNPAGKRPGPHLGPAMLRALFREDRQTVHDELLRLALEGKTESIRLAALIEIANRSDGKPRAAEDIEAEDSKPPPPSPEVVAAVARAMAGPGSH